MLLSNVAPNSFICVGCSKNLKEDTKPIHNFNCGHNICQDCFGSDANGKDKPRCPIDKEELSTNTLVNDIEFMDYIKGYNVDKLECELHEENIEYFSRSDQKFVCVKCLSQFLEKDKTPDDLIQVSGLTITKDLYTLRKSLMNCISDLDTFLQLHNKDSNYLSKFVKNSIQFIEGMEDRKITKDLLMFRKLIKKDEFKSTISSSKLQNVAFKPIEKLRDVSKIITQEMEENFINSLFDEKMQLSLLHRASEHNFKAESFHRDCDNKGATLCLFKSEKGKIFGGYSDKNWFSKITFKTSRKSFLFSLDYKKKLKSFRNFERALFFSANNGPSFGEDLIIGDLSNQPKSCRSLLGRTYDPCEGYYESYEAQKSLAGKPNFALVEYEVYMIRFS